MELIVAITDNFVIGANGVMPWHLPADLQHFKKITSGHAIAMGRRTWDSIGRPLPNNFNLRELIIDFGVSGYVALYRYDREQDAVYILAFRHQKEAGY